MLLSMDCEPEFDEQTTLFCRFDVVRISVDRCGMCFADFIFYV